MNYFTHAVRYLDNDYFAVGSCIPDLLAVIDRKARLRMPTVDAKLSELEETPRNRTRANLIRGIRQHLHDDRWFHGTAGFYSVTGQLGAQFRTVLPEEESWRCGFLGHLVMELLLDSVLIEIDRNRLERFYNCFRSVNASRVQQIVSEVASREVPNLAWMLGRLLDERFLDDYVDDVRLLTRVNQVMKRVQLERLPESVLPVLAFGRQLVKANVDELLPADRFEDRAVFQITP